MNDHRLTAHKQRLDALFKKVKSLGDDPEMMAHWSRYLCVLVSGFIETSIRTLVLELAQSRSCPRVSRFVGLRIKDFTNAKMNKILDLLNEFDLEWKEELREFAEGDLKDAVDSVVANRHQIAHGKDTGIGFVTIKDYYDRVLKVVEEVERKVSS